MNEKTKTLAAFAAAIAALAWAGPLSAHHSLGMFDLTVPVRIKGSVVRFERVNPHSIIYIDERREDGQVERWAVIGPSVTQLDGRHIAQDFLKAGDSIEVCGFATKDGASRQPAPAQPASSNPDASKPNGRGRLMNGHVLVMPDGRKWFWSDYGQLRKCIGADEIDSLVR